MQHDVQRAEPTFSNRERSRLNRVPDDSSTCLERRLAVEVGIAA